MRLFNLFVLGLCVSQVIITAVRWSIGDCPEWFGYSIITANCISAAIVLDILRRDAR